MTYSTSFKFFFASTIILHLLCRVTALPDDGEPASASNINQHKPKDTMSAIPAVTFEEVRNLDGNNSVLLIDVRQPNELKENGVIPSSINIPLSDVEDVLKNMPADEFKSVYGRDKPSLDFPLVFSCRSGRRSAAAAAIAVKLGFTNVRNYEGSWLDWEQKIKQ